MPPPMPRMAPAALEPPCASAGPTQTANAKPPQIPAAMAWRDMGFPRCGVPLTRPGVAARVDPAAQLLGVGAAVGAEPVELGEHHLRAGDVAAGHLQFAVVFGGADVVGGDGQRLAVVALGAVVVALLAPSVALVGEDVGVRTEDG